MLVCISWMNLNAFWIQASLMVAGTLTVAGNKDRSDFGITLSGIVGLYRPYLHNSLMPSCSQHCKYKIAVQVLLHCWHPGKHSFEDVQFKTTCKLCTSHITKLARALPQAYRHTLLMADMKGSYQQRLSVDPSASFWFSQFIKGCRFCMGQDWRANQAMSLPLLLAVLMGSNKGSKMLFVPGSTINGLSSHLRTCH